jgi:hypothetical protein
MLPMLRNSLSEQAVIALDDVDRSAERATAEDWARTLGMNIDFHESRDSTGREFAVLRPA